MVLESLFMRGGGLSDDDCNRLDPKDLVILCDITTVHKLMTVPRILWLVWVAVSSSERVV
jgi:hypothetical protein